jgi:hypothetical protein
MIMSNSQKNFNQEELIKYVDQMLVNHTAFIKAISSLQQAFKVAPSITDPFGLFIVGESRTGKSRVIEEFMSERPALRTDESLEISVVKVIVPSKPSVKGLAAEILRAMGDPMADKGTEQLMTARLLLLLKHCKVRMLILDEAQHLIDKTSKYSLIHHVSDWLKNLMNQSKVVVVIAGLEYAKTILSQNEQLRGRFASQIQMPRFDWRNDESRAEFLGLMAGFSEYLSERFNIPDLGSNEVALRFYLASGGLIGYVMNILRKTVWNAVQRGEVTIELEDFDVGFKEAVSQDNLHAISPFSRLFNLNDGQAFMKAVEIGMRADHYLPEKVRRAA